MSAYVKDMFWKFIWMVIICIWYGVILYSVLGYSFNNGTGLRPPIFIFMLWILIPIIWMLCSGFGLYDHYEHELGLRDSPAPEGGIYSVKLDTTPGKRIALLSVAPFALIYFVVRDNRRHRRQITR